MKAGVSIDIKGKILSKITCLYMNDRIGFPISVLPPFFVKNSIFLEVWKKTKEEHD